MCLRVVKEWRHRPTICSHVELGFKLLILTLLTSSKLRIISYFPFMSRNPIVTRISALLQICISTVII